MGHITTTADTMIMAKHYLSLSPKPPQELTRLHGVAEVLKYIFSFGLIDAGNDRYQACRQTLFAGLSRLPTAQEVSNFNSPDNSASLKIEFSVPFGRGMFERITATLTHDPEDANQDILTVDASDEPSVTVTLPPTGANISQHLRTLVEAHLKKPIFECLCNLQGVDLQGVDLRGVDLQGVDLQGVSFAGAVLDKKQVNYIVKSRLNEHAAPSALCGAILPMNLLGVDFTDIQLDGTAVGQIAQAIRDGLADKTALVMADVRGVDLNNVDLRGVILPVDLRGTRFAGALLGGPEVAQITQAIRAKRASTTALQGANLIDANLKGLNLRGADLSGATLPTNLHDVSFAGARMDALQVEVIANAFVQKCANENILQGATLTGHDLHSVDLRGLNLNWTDLRGTRLPDDLSKTSIVGAQLDGNQIMLIVNASIQDSTNMADLRGMDLRGMDLTGMNLYSTRLSGANLFGLDLRGVILPRDLRDVGFAGALLDGSAVAKIALAIREGQAEPEALVGANMLEGDWLGSALYGVDLSGLGVKRR